MFYTVIGGHLGFELDLLFTNTGLTQMEGQRAAIFMGSVLEFVNFNVNGLNGKSKEKES